jgi:hypothetical protein
MRICCAAATMVQASQVSMKMLPPTTGAAMTVQRV